MPTKKVHAAACCVLMFLIGAAISLRADTAAFPKYDSVFTITVPPDCTAKFEADSLVIRPVDEKDFAHFVFRELPSSVHDADSAQKYLEPYVEGQLHSLGISATKRNPVKEEAINDQLKGFVAQVEGKWTAPPGNGHLVFYTASTFSFDGKRYFLMVSVRSYTATADYARNKALKQSIAGSTTTTTAVGFPKDKPQFTIALPKGWKANVRGDGTMLLSSTTGQDISSLWGWPFERAVTIENEAAAKGYTRKRAEELTEGLQFTETKCTKPVTDVKIAGHPAFTTAYRGLMKAKPFYFDLATFTPDGRHYFYVFGLAPEGTGKPALEHQHEIIESIRASE